MIRWPIFAIPVILTAVGASRRIEEFTFAFGAALAMTTVLSALVPAIRVYQQIGLDPASLQHINPGAYLDQLRDLPPTRDGVLRHLELLGLGGIVTFPSFHAASAVHYVWVLWPARWFRPVVVVVNGLMLAATPVNGGHYLIDLVAGMAIAVAAIAAARTVSQEVVRRQLSFALPAPVAVPAE